MDTVYVILINDGFLTEETYTSFEYASYVCETMTGIRPTEADRIYEIEPMKYVRIKSLALNQMIRHGKWVYKEHGWYCNICNSQADFWSMSSAQHCGNFCSNCGATMEFKNNTKL